MGQTIGGDFAKFCGLLRIVYEVYLNCLQLTTKSLNPLIQLKNKYPIQRKCLYNKYSFNLILWLTLSM